MSQLSFAKVISRSVLSRPATRLYPFVKRPFFKAARGAVAIDIDKCILCGICQKRCPTAAIIVTKASGDWQINRLRCISCGACVDACPKKCLWLENMYSPAVVKKGADDKFHQQPKPGLGATQA